MLFCISMIHDIITCPDEDDPHAHELDDLDPEHEGGLGHGVLPVVREVPRGKVGALLEDLACHRECHDGNFPRSVKLWKVEGQFNIRNEDRVQCKYNTK